MIPLLQSEKLKDMIEAMRIKSINIKKNAILDAIAKLPEKEQLAVKTSFAAMQCRSSNGIRYMMQWVLECLLLRIKSKKAYTHLRKHKILTLPSVQTLNKYLKVVKGAYGFQQAVFEALKIKTASMSLEDVRGM